MANKGVRPAFGTETGNVERAESRKEAWGYKFATALGAASGMIFAWTLLRHNFILAGVFGLIMLGTLAYSLFKK